MSNQLCPPDLEAAKRLLANLRQTHFEIQDFNLDLEEITARIEYDLRQQKLIRERQSLGYSFQFGHPPFQHRKTSVPF
ncbi:MAG: hypothetical protein WCD18_12765 [Thermosynechococcaceae cyanobacterium]